MGIIWTILIGFIAGVLAKFITPGSNEPSGFILTTILGIIGAIVATYLGQALGWYEAGQGAGHWGNHRASYLGSSRWLITSHKKSIARTQLAKDWLSGMFRRWARYGGFSLENRIGLICDFSRSQRRGRLFGFG